MKKLIVLFPGVGYHNDKPLMYYTKRTAKRYDYEIIDLSFDFSNAAKFIKGDEESIRKVIDVAASQAEDQLKDVRFSEYDRVTFAGKSIGTAVMAKYASAFGLEAEMIVFTPIAETFNYLENCDEDKRCVVFHGSADPLIDTELCVRLCEEKSLKYTVIPNANHSLETGDVETDIRILGNVMSDVDRILQY